MHPFDICRRPAATSRRAKASTTQKPRQSRIDVFAAVNDAALPQLDGLCRDWLPGGRRQGAEYVVRNPTRGDVRPGSFKINVRTGLWADFATGDCGGDPISLRAYLDGTRQIEAARIMAAELGVST